MGQNAIKNKYTARQNESEWERRTKKKREGNFMLKTFFPSINFITNRNK